MRPCHAVRLDDSVVVLLGGAPTPDAIGKLRTVVFVLAAISKNEVRAIAADASAADARASAKQAESLTRALAATHEEVQGVLAELRQSQEWLSTTLRSIGDAVMTTDPAGRITFLNPHAEGITGWSDAEAHGRRAADVFHIVDATTRARVDCPVARVLRERTVVGLANHTVLVRRDGTEVPIDDSAAPIYDRSGELAGTVLVFRDVTERKRAQAKHDASVRRAQLVAAVGSALTSREPLGRQLDACMAAIVSHLGAAFARTWTVDESGHVLELQASAGLYTHLDGPHARVPVGQFKIGRIAAKKKPHLTNDVAGDPHVSDAAWALREGMVAFAGYPLLVGDRVVGVTALFSRSILAAETLDVLAAIADAIAVAVDRARREADLARSAERLRGLTAASLIVGAGVSVEDVLQSLADKARDLIGAHQSVTSLTVSGDWTQAITALSLSEKYVAWKAYAEKPDASDVYAHVCETNGPLRMTQAELEAHPRLHFGKHAENHPPMRGCLAVPLVSREGRNIGVLLLSDKVAGEFTEQDEAILVQLARFASVALDNAALLARASRAARAREQMLAIVSHDLRNPLGTIVVAASFIDEAAHSDEAAVRERLARYSGMVRRAAERMTKLVGDLLDFGSIESGRLTLDKKPIDGFALAREAYEAHEAIAVANEVSLSISVPDGEATIDADRDRLAQVFANLVGNALKFTHAPAAWTSARNDASTPSPSRLPIPARASPRTSFRASSIPTARPSRLPEKASASASSSRRQSSRRTVAASRSRVCPAMARSSSSTSLARDAIRRSRRPWRNTHFRDAVRRSPASGGGPLRRLLLFSTAPGSFYGLIEDSAWRRNSAPCSFTRR